MKRLLLLALGFIAVAAASAASLPPAARAEIAALMTKLEAAGCEFNRNGAWYSGAEAKSHLLGKLKYLEDRGAVQSAEQFIELAASSSSVSGRPYMVKCRSDSPVESRTWLLAQLRALRAGG